MKYTCSRLYKNTAVKATELKTFRWIPRDGFYRYPRTFTLFFLRITNDIVTNNKNGESFPAFYV